MIGAFFSFVFLSIFLLVCTLFIINIKLKSEKKTRQGKIAIIDISLFLMSAIALFISFGLFINTALYVSNHQYRGGTNLVTGGMFWTNMMWLEIPILFCLTLILGIKIIRNKKK